MAGFTCPMCTRFSRSQQELEVNIGGRAYRIDAGWPQYIIRPTDRAAVIVAARDETLDWRRMRWGFWSTYNSAIVNAPADALATHDLFRGSYRSQRCLVPACGYFERDAARKLPVRFVPRQGGGLLFAALWNRFSKVGEAFTIVTIGANADVAPYHDRMPVILDAQGAGRWLMADGDDPRGLLESTPDGVLEGYHVTTLVFGHTFSGPEAVRPSTPIQRTLF
jgi:putative SOS response-associated peptidase YedK